MRKLGLLIALGLYPFTASFTYACMIERDELLKAGIIFFGSVVSFVGIVETLIRGRLK